MRDSVSSIALPSPRHLLISLVAALVIAGAARAAKALTVSGAVAAAVVGALIFGLAGWQGAVALLLFFATSTVLGRVGRRRKEGVGFEKGGERDAAQVLANGGVAALCASLLPFFSPARSGSSPGFWVRWRKRTPIRGRPRSGRSPPRPPRLITTFQRAAPGRSGAVSIPGTLAALGGAALIAATAPFWHLPRPAALIFSALVGGFAGALADSLLGATVQAQYRCPNCGRLTERHVHCGDHVTTLAHGLRWLKNDGVNALSTFIGASVAALLALLTK